MKIILWVSLLRLFCAAVCHGSTENDRGKVILDISRIVRYAVETGRNATLGRNALRAIATESIKIDGPSLMFYDTELKNGRRNLGKTISLLGDLQKEFPSFKPKLLVSIKDTESTEWTGQEIRIDNYVQEHYSRLLFLAAKNSSLIAGISFQLTNVGNVCQRNSQKMMNLAQEVKHLGMNHKLGGFHTNEIEIGYTTDLEYLDCLLHSENKNQSDYIIVNIPLQLNDKLFVESYGIFREKIERTVITRTSKPIYYRLKLNAVVARGQVADYVTLNGQKLKLSRLHSMPRQVLHQLRDLDQKTAIKYEHLLTKYVQEWTSTAGTSVILNYLHGTEFTNSNSESLEWMKSNIGIIPYFTDVPLGFKVTLSASAKILLEDVASSGFNTIMINGRIWKELIKNQDYISSCNGASLERMNVIYMIDENNRGNLQSLHEACSMRVQTIVFSNKYMETPQFHWNDALEAFRKSKNDDYINSDNTLRSACHTWSDAFNNLNKYGISCTNSCDAESAKIKYIMNCGSVTNSTNAFIWSVKFDFPNRGDVDMFVEKTMKGLDAIVVARQIFFLQYPSKTVILQIRGEYAPGNWPGTQSDLYCSPLGERINQFYEAIVTWARIHEFPVILEMVHGPIGYGNPFTWTEVSITKTGGMKEVMKSGPLYLRRSYNQSKIMGTWTQGMFPCIKNATKLSDVNLNFEHDFTGVTLNLKLRSGNASLELMELQTVLLFALGKFAKVEITLEASQLELLSESVSSPIFQNSLKLNDMYRKKIYLIIGNISSNSIHHLNEIASAMKPTGSSIIIQDKNNIFHKVNVNFEISLARSNCTNLARKIVSRQQNLNDKLKRVSYLICETEPVSVTNSNIGQTDMQDYLDSHWYLNKLVRYFYSNLKQIDFRLQPTLEGRSLKSQMKNLLSFLSEVNSYSTAYKIHYFFLPAFVNENQSDRVPTFWTITNYTNLSDVSVYLENQANFLNKPTWIPKISNITELSLEMSILSEDQKIF